MEQRATLVTLAVRNMDAARRFYVEGLGWDPILDVAGEVIFLQIGHGIALSLWNADEMAKEAGGLMSGDGAPPVVFSHNVGSSDEVDAVLNQAVAAGATLIAAGQSREWGGYSGYFGDPDGYRWEVAHNAGFVIGEDGRIEIGPVPS